MMMQFVGPFLSSKSRVSSSKTMPFVSPLARPRVADRYNDFGQEVLQTPPTESPSNLSLGGLSDDTKYLFQETQHAKVAASQFMKAFLASDRNQELCSSIYREKISYLRSVYSADDARLNQVNSKCLGFTILSREIESDERELFCLVTLSGTDEGEDSGIFDQLICALRDTAEDLSLADGQFQFMFSANPSSNFRELIALEQDEAVEADWRKACAELPAVKWLCEIFSNPDYMDQLSIGGGMFMFLPKPEELFKSSVTVKDRDMRKKGYFKIEAGSYEFKGRPIPACLDCQHRKVRYVQLIQAAAKKGVAKYFQEQVINRCIKTAMSISEQKLENETTAQCFTTPERIGTSSRHALFTHTPDGLPENNRKQNSSRIMESSKRSALKEINGLEASPLVMSLDGLFKAVGYTGTERGENENDQTAFAA